MDFDSPETNYCANDQFRSFGYYVFFGFFFLQFIYTVYTYSVWVAFPSQTE